MLSKSCYDELKMAIFASAHCNGQVFFSISGDTMKMEVLGQSCSRNKRFISKHYPKTLQILQVPPSKRVLKSPGEVTIFCIIYHSLA